MLLTGQGHTKCDIMRFRKLDPARDMNEFLVLLTESLRDHPVYSAAKELFADNGDYMYFLRTMLATFLRIQVKYNTVILGTEGDRIVCGAILRTPKDETPSKKDFLLSMGLNEKLPASPRETAEFYNMVMHLDDMTLSAGKEDNWTLTMLSVKRDMRSRGAGSYFMKNCVIPYVRHHGGRVLTLTAHTSKTAEFYEKMGFEVFDSTPADYRGRQLYSRCMKLSLENGE